MAITYHLPYPPSVNRIWRHGKKPGQVYLDPKYRAWKREAGLMIMEQRRKQGRVAGHFEAIIHLAERRRRKNTDVDNRLKAILDALQEGGIIENDALCDSITGFWADTTDGCSVSLFEVAAFSLSDAERAARRDLLDRAICGSTREERAAAQKLLAVIEKYAREAFEEAKKK